MRTKASRAAGEAHSTRGHLAVKHADDAFGPVFFGRSKREPPSWTGCLAAATPVRVRATSGRPEPHDSPHLSSGRKRCTVGERGLSFRHVVAFPRCERSATPGTTSSRSTRTTCVSSSTASSWRSKCRRSRMRGSWPAAPTGYVVEPAARRSRAGLRLQAPHLRPARRDARRPVLPRGQPSLVGQEEGLVHGPPRPGRRGRLPAEPSLRPREQAALGTPQLGVPEYWLVDPWPAPSSAWSCARGATSSPPRSRRGTLSPESFAGLEVPLAKLWE